MADTGLLIVFSGPSGAGKGTICEALRKNFPNVNYSISMTTRQPRVGEKDGVDYYFTSASEFETLLKKQAFLEYAKVYDYYYGTPKEHVYGLLAQGKHVLLEIDIQGAMQVRAQYPNCVCIYIVPPSLDILAKRLRDRHTDTEEVICKRLHKTKEELQWISKYDYLIINNDLSQAIKEAIAIVQAEQCKVIRLQEKREKILNAY